MRNKSLYKKRLHLKRRRKKYLTRRIITDTMIWYNLGKNEDLFKRIQKRRITPNFINLFELCITKNLITTRKESVRKALQRLYYFEKNLLLTPPYITIAQLTNEFVFNGKNEFSYMISKTKKFAHNGEDIIPANQEKNFRNHFAEKDAKRQEYTDWLNGEAKTIRERIKNKKEHRKKNTYQITGEVINMFVEESTGKKYNIDGLKLSKIELLIKTYDTFLKAIETGQEHHIEINDWLDLEILGYIRPGDKFWTKEKKWIRLIKESKCEHYLFNENNRKRSISSQR